MNTLTIENLSKTYPNGTEALQSISLQLTDGMFGLLGANGAGKSSLMRTLATLQEPTLGTITFNKNDILKNPDAIRHTLGYLPQEFGVYPKISAQEMLNYLGILKGLENKKERKEQVNALLQQTNLYQQRKNSVATFSGGMRQRFGIAQALLGNPKLIIVDEPTAGLDPTERNRFLNLLSEIGENRIVILSTHFVEDIRELCTNMAIMGQGKIITKGNPNELISTLKDCIWTKMVEKNEVLHLKNRFQVISTKLIGGKTQLTIFSKTVPNEGFKPKMATLEDFYFTKSNL
ncbi:ABC transporter ATP-binding protein [Bernardetia sp. Wsw4-3y2]|uniref:ABC transporter ATP-binding protein n=1 Tax=Bernardetia sp. Wsw4-3y2 TaxID=3127471 RepID=UPI0030D56182